MTGAGRGVGRAIALELGREGCRLALAARSVDQVVSVANEVQTRGQQAIAVATDVTDERAVAVLIERTKAVFGRIDVLVNAVSLPHSGAYDELEKSQWDALLATNLTGPHLCMRTLVPIMREQGSGLILNVAEGPPPTPGAAASAYAAASAGVVGLTRALAAELAEAGIRVNAICPARGSVDPDEVAATAVFLAASNSISGEAIALS